MKELLFTISSTVLVPFGPFDVEFKRPSAEQTLPWVGLSQRVSAALLGEAELTPDDLRMCQETLHTLSVSLDGQPGRLSLTQLREDIPASSVLSLWSMMFVALQLGALEKKSSALTSSRRSPSGSLAPLDTAQTAKSNGGIAPTPPSSPNTPAAKPASGPVAPST